MLISMVMLVVVAFSGCNKDFRLNGTWSGELWENGEMQEDSKVTFTFNSGSVTIKLGSVEIKGSYTTSPSLFYNKIILKIDEQDVSYDYDYYDYYYYYDYKSFVQSLDKSYETLKGVYRFSFPIGSKTLYLSDVGSVFPDKEDLKPDIGPVFILRKF